MNASIKVQHKHEPTMKAVRVNGKISEVKQSALRLILRWVTIWDPNILSFISLAMISKNIRQIRHICQILLISFSFGKTQISTTRLNFSFQVIRQPNQEGTPAVFRNDIDKWGTYNVVYVDGKNNVSPPGSRTSWHKQYKVVHGGPEFKGKL